MAVAYSLQPRCLALALLPPDPLALAWLSPPMMPRMVPGSPSAHSLHSGRTVHAVVQTQRAASRSSGLAPLSQ